MTSQELVDAFTAKAQAVNAVVREESTMAAALQYVADVCANKSPAEILADEPDAEKGPLGPNKQPTRVHKIVAAPQLPKEDFDQLAKLCEERGLRCIHEGVRAHLAGIDVGVGLAELGVAASGTCLCNVDNEDVRLSGMVSEISILLLKKSAIYPDLPSVADKLRERVGHDNPSYTTFITGPSRTADIERVAAVGVHGPLELHIILLEG